VARLALPLVLLATLLAGCGGSTARKPPLSKRAFVAEANRICAQARTRTGRLARLHALRPPVGDEDLYAYWLKAERDALEATKPIRKKPEKPLFDPDVAETVAEGKIAGYARRLGVATCAKRTIATMPP
jgi:hypothetical protein